MNRKANPYYAAARALLRKEGSVLTGAEVRKDHPVKRRIFPGLRTEKGFTLIEIMVVIIIIGILASIVGPKMFGNVEKARLNAASAQIEMLGTALDSFRLDVGRYPTTAEGLEALITQVSGVDGWNGPYLKKREVPLDPWKRPYRYECPGNFGDYDLYTYGKDDAEGGEGEDRDVASWKSLK